MAQVFVGIGSNIERTTHIAACLDALAQHFDHLVLSSVYESEAIGFSGDNFYNLVAGFDSNLAIGELSRLLRSIESDNGRTRRESKFSGRSLDIDILIYDRIVGVVDNVQLPRQEILENAFVLQPLAELVPGLVHPLTGISYGEHWQNYDQGSQKLWRIDFWWRGAPISVRG
ncbi:MAG: 2-amino-4-hydroxy-6-hydroxymethyldihydropteridine diphosphokinase [Porticoccaceae bacterium]|nr:2-amino-4-hydroxy-6-hydroxymethyldihydropteridine diphosphokinase [Porticoccaceae bacterium]